MTPKPVWRSAHIEIDGRIIDREQCNSPLILEMRPMGIMLPVGEQTRNLRLAIGSEHTILDEEGIAALVEFLRITP
jgi:hypothetical protein